MTSSNNRAMIKNGTTLKMVLIYHLGQRVEIHQLLDVILLFVDEAIFPSRQRTAAILDPCPYQRNVFTPSDNKLDASIVKFLKVVGQWTEGINM